MTFLDNPGIFSLLVVWLNKPLFPLRASSVYATYQLNCSSHHHALRFKLKRLVRIDLTGFAAACVSMCSVMLLTPSSSPLLNIVRYTCRYT